MDNLKKMYLIFSRCGGDPAKLIAEYSSKEEAEEISMKLRDFIDRKENGCYLFRTGKWELISPLCWEREYYTVYIVESTVDLKWEELESQLRSRIF